jgi:sugar lactone lactonase YvrE
VIEEQQMDPGDAGGDAPQRGRGVPTRLVWLAVLLVSAAGLAYVAYLLLGGREATSPPRAEVSSETTGTAVLVDAFPGASEDRLANPLGIAGSEGTLYVAESDAGAIRVFDEGGEGVGAIVVPPADGFDSAYPVSVALVGEDAIAVVDTVGQRVVLLSTDLERDDPLLNVVGCLDPSTIPVQPTAVAADDRVVLVADAATGTIRRYTHTGECVDEIGGDFEPPLTFAGGMVLGSDRIWVSDSNSARVLMLDSSDGTLLGTLQGELQLPRGLALDEGGSSVYVADRFAGTVEVFDLAGTFLQSVESLGSRESAVEIPLGMPNDVLWDDESRRLYVVDPTSGRVLVTGAE